MPAHDSDQLVLSHDSPSSSSVNNPPTKRKRSSGTTSSSRGVANLTPDQLARKRANDREAQRAIRERTKHQIDALNQRIRELESQQPYNDLQVVIREKDAIRAENEDIKRRLTSVMGLIQPLVNNNGLHELAAAAERNTLPYLQTTIPPPQLPSHAENYSKGRIANQYATPSDVTSKNTPPQDENLTEHISKRWPDPTSATSNDLREWHARGLGNSQSESHNGQDERLGVGFLLERTSKDQIGAPISVPIHVIVPAGCVNESVAPHTMLPKTTEPACLLDNLMSTFLNDGRAATAQGTPIENILGPPYMDFSPFIYPGRIIESHATSKVFTDILRTFPDIASLPEQVAVSYVMFLMMRWQLHPTKENYDRLPAWVKPLPSALFVPHQGWIDYVPWPKLREFMVYQNPPQAFENFFIPYSTTISLNWPHPQKDCLIPLSALHSRTSFPNNSASRGSPLSTHGHHNSPHTPDSNVRTPGSTSTPLAEPWVVSPAFEIHLRDLANWTLGPSFATALPHLGEHVRIKPDN